MAIAMFGARHPFISHLVRSGAVEVLGGFFGRCLAGIYRLNRTATWAGLSQGGSGQHQGSSKQLEQAVHRAVAVHRSAS
jgi:hypothetical protein